MKVLVTGGAGFAGSVLTEMLLEHQHEVVVLDTFQWGVRPLLHLLSSRYLTLVQCEMVEEEITLGRWLQHVDAVINLAGVVGYPECARKPAEAKYLNTNMVEYMCDRLSRNQIFIQASTGSVYGKLDKICTERSPTKPLTIYGQTKLEAEKYVLDFNGACPRFATAFGVSPCMRFELLPNFLVWKAVREKYLVVYESAAKRTLIDVRDMARAYVDILEHYDTFRGEVVNIGDEKLNVTKKQIVDIVTEIVPDTNVFDETNLSDKDARDYAVSYAKAKRLGFECKYGLKEGLTRVAELARIITNTERSSWRVD